LKHWELRRSRPNRTSIGLPHASSSPSFSRSLHVFPMFWCHSLPGKPFPISFLRRLFGFRWGPPAVAETGPSVGCGTWEPRWKISTCQMPCDTCRRWRPFSECSLARQS
jgi:hypothetical protein